MTIPLVKVQVKSMKTLSKFEWKNLSGLHSVLTSTQLNAFEINCNADCIPMPPCLISEPDLTKAFMKRNPVLSHPRRDIKKTQKSCVHKLLAILGTQCRLVHLLELQKHFYEQLMEICLDSQWFLSTNDFLSTKKCMDHTITCLVYSVFCVWVVNDMILYLCLYLASQFIKSIQTKGALY